MGRTTPKVVIIRIVQAKYKIIRINSERKLKIELNC